MVFRSKGARTYKVRVASLDGALAATCSTGTTDLATAREVAAFVRRLKARRNAPVLVAIAARRGTLASAFDADVAGRLDAWLAALDDVDLSPLVDAWAAAGANAKYVAQVRRFVPAGRRFPRSAFTRAAISGFLAGLTQARGGAAGRAAGAQTKRRYRAALSVFARWLVERDVLPSNPVRDVEAAKAPGQRPITFLDAADVRRLVDGLSGESRALEALMAGTGVEWGACAALRRADVDFDARLVHARGTKNDYRDRWVEVSEYWAWDVFAAHARQLAPNAPVFTIREPVALAAHHAAAKALGLKRTTLHQHRHSFAVMWIKRSEGREDRMQWLKNQLGHAPQSVLIWTLYGVYIKAARLTEKQRARLGETPAEVASTVTSPKKLREVRRAK